MHGDGQQTYTQRNNRNINLGEHLFEQYCDRMGYTYNRLGFDEKHNPVPNFYLLNDTIRHLPDYVVQRPNAKRIGLAAVKGTRKIKKEEYDRIDWMEQTYSGTDSEFWFVFALSDGVYWRSPQQVKALWEESTVTGVWPDGKQWKELTL